MNISDVLKNKEVKSSTDKAKNAVLHFRKFIKNTRLKDSRQILKKLNQLREDVFSQKNTGSITKNAVNCVLHDIKSQNVDKVKHDLNKNINQSLDHLNNSYQRISEIGYKKIKRGMVVYVHDYSPYVIDVLRRAKKEGIHFEVVTTEASPFFTGYLIATHLARHDIPVTFYADLAIRQALKRSDIILLDADALASNGKIYSEIGSELIADLADKYDVPVYVCTDSWKLSPDAVLNIDKNTELRPKEEIWKKPPRGVTVLNYSYEKISPRLITGIITEMGIYKPHYLIPEIKNQYPWIK